MQKLDYALSSFP